MFAEGFLCGENLEIYFMIPITFLDSMLFSLKKNVNTFIGTDNPTANL